ncbi:degenerin-like protein asic-1 [Gigantopelta aegis]|uniref:degenerin-like protein asic-1 n=1 Tax=Gigantopelta aegis TaxID=1735272 RepID=UPI001B88C7EF|nr:degenerin-like protein asic-1 [Gigantopelta aegis]
MDVLKVAKAAEAFGYQPPVAKAKEAFREKLKNKEENTLNDKVDRFFNETSFTALTRVYNASNWFKRICWLVVLLGMMSWLTVQCYWLFERYFSYPVEVKMDLVSARELAFPSVTVCNLNPLKHSKRHKVPFNEIQAFVEIEYNDILYSQFQTDYLGDKTNFDYELEITDNTNTNIYPPPPPPAADQTTTSNSANKDSTTTATQSPPTASSADKSTASYTSYGDSTTDIQPPRPPPPTPGDKIRRRRQASMDWNLVFQNNTFNKWDMLEDSKLSSKFYKERDDDYRAAMAYASFSKRHPERTVMRGGHKISDFIVSCKMAGFMCSPKNFTRFLNHKYGNCFTFNGQDNTVNVTTQFSGPVYGLSLELYIEQTEYIGALSPAAGVRVLIHPRNSMPFPEDQGISIPPGYETSIGIRKVDIGRLPAPHGSCAIEGKEPDLYVLYKNTTYSKLSCMKSCYQRLSILHCGCAVPFFYVVGETNICDMTKTDKEKCVKNLPEIQEQAFIQCDLDCPQPLRISFDFSEVKYETTLSSAQWPSNQYANTMTMRVQQSNYLFMGTTMDTGKQFAKLQVYYQDLMFEKIEQKKAYESPNLISDVGGQLGLWLGLSAITIGELFSFIISLAKALIVRKKTTTPVTPMEQVDLKSFGS